MNDKDFDKIFGDKLREERYFASLDKNWEQLNTRLDTASQSKVEDKKRRAADWLWLLLLPFLSLLLWEMNGIKNQNNTLANQLAAVQAQLIEQKVAQGNAVQTVHKTDTIIVYKNISESKSLKSKSLHKDLGKNISASPPLSAASKQQIKNVGEVQTSPMLVRTLTDTLPDNHPINQSLKITELNEKLANLDKQLSDLKQILLDNKSNATLIADCSTQQNLLKKQLDDAIALTDSLKKHPLSTEPKKTDKPLNKNRLFIGLQGGQIFYKMTWVNSIGIDLYKNNKSYQAGLKAEYVLTDKLRLIAEGNFCPFEFTNFWQNTRYNLPALQFDPAKEKFLKAEAKQDLLQGNIGIKYLFTEEGAKWRPYVSAAYTMMKIKAFDTKFTYQPLWGTTLREQIAPSPAVKIPNLLMLNGGLEYRFSKYGVAQAEAFYFKDINKTKKTFDLFGIRAALLVNLK